MATIQELLLLGKQTLEDSGNEYAKYERKVLLEEVLGCNYLYMLTHGEEEVSKEQEERFLKLLKRRQEHYPLQYLLGIAHFMDYAFYVDENVLIPRNDTEILTECASGILSDRERQKDAEHLQVLDLCCGSGCIGISLKLYHEKISLFLSDCSESALKVAVRNLQKYEVKGEILCGDLFAPFAGKADLIVCNPPYIETGVVGTLMPEVKDYEPVLALDGGEDGLDYYRRIIPAAPEHLEDSGWLLFEIGSGQGEAVSGLMRKAGFGEVQVKKDYAGLDRVVLGQKMTA